MCGAGEGADPSRSIARGSARTSRDVDGAERDSGTSSFSPAGDAVKMASAKVLVARGATQAIEGTGFRMQRSEAEIHGWEHLAGPAAQELIQRVEACSDLSALAPADLAALRSIADAALVGLAIELVRARRRAARKFIEAERLWADLEGVEQASGTNAAAWKARRFAGAAVERVVDLCTGIGGDLIELVRALPGAEVSGVDLDPVRSWMASRNAGCPTEVADVGSLGLAGRAFHIDPARRVEGGGRRLRSVDDYRPGRSVLDALVASGAPGALKLGPGADLDDVPGGRAGEIEILGGEDGLLQAVVWCGPLAAGAGTRTATRVDRGDSFSGRPGRLPVTTKPGAYLLVAEPALERAGLVAARAPEGLLALPAGDGWAVADSPMRDPWFRSFEVLDVLPWRERRLRAALRAADAGIVHVKIRGRIAEANAMERALRGDGAEAVWVFGYREGERSVAVLARSLALCDVAGEDGRGDIR